MSGWASWSWKICDFFQWWQQFLLRLLKYAASWQVWDTAIRLYISQFISCLFAVAQLHTCVQKCKVISFYLGLLQCLQTTSGKGVATPPPLPWQQDAVLHLRDTAKGAKGLNILPRFTQETLVNWIWMPWHSPATELVLTGEIPSSKPMPPFWWWLPPKQFACVQLSFGADGKQALMDTWGWWLYQMTGLCHHCIVTCLGLAVLPTRSCCSSTDKDLL